MNNEKLLAGLDAGHINTKAVIMKGRDILGYATVPTACDAMSAARSALNDVLKSAGISGGELDGVVATGIFRDALAGPVLNVVASVPEYVADAKGAFFLNNKSRTVIDIGGNVHKAMSYDEKGNLLDVIQNDKCADGLGIFYTGIAKLLGISEDELSQLALKSTKRVSVAIQCALAAESEAIDLMCQGVDAADVADAITRYIVERVAAMSTYLPLTEEIVAAGGLARSQAVVNHLQRLIKHEVSVVSLPEYVGAIGAVVSHGGGK
ncbi:MAG TPA: acyl-CoA dehydratase activase [Syntrophorhabdaceae bacterium]|nr:acyl-CoA dehydratase activase [Syntrophorhabdaceae bacterium]HQM82635.1 acyl-CoA dehydratase activase [Syntrophorhabdaceae bacterium]